MAGTVVICFTDIVGSTDLLTSVGDDAFDQLRRRHFDTLERQVEAHGGDLVKSLGESGDLEPWRLPGIDDPPVCAGSVD